MIQDNEEYQDGTDQKEEIEVVKYQDGINVSSDEDYIYIESTTRNGGDGELLSFQKCYANAMCKAILHHAS